MTFRTILPKMYKYDQTFTIWGNVHESITQFIKVSMQEKAKIQLLRGTYSIWFALAPA
jgi:hypothetical protein